jgi:HEAT repeats
MPRLLPALLLASLIGPALVTGSARAEQQVAYLIEQLKTSDDYRVRTQAALALGSSGDDAAVKPLCDALGDGNNAVKVASAAALGKLGKPAGLPCLKAALGKESAPSVKAQMEKSITTLGQSGSSGGGAGSSGGAAPATPPPPGADTKFYVAIQVTNKTKRGAAEVDAIVRAAMQDKLLAKKGYAVAPKAETTAEGGQIVKSKKLKGFFLIVTVESPVYAGSDLSQAVKVTLWTYPDKALQGEFGPKLTQSGTTKGDTQSETLLMKMCAENAVESFQKVAASM